MLFPQIWLIFLSWQVAEVVGVMEAQLAELVVALVGFVQVELQVVALPELLKLHCF